MKVLFLIGICVVGVASSTGKVDYHLNSMLKSFPVSPTLIQLQARMASSTTIDVRDEIAALLFEMQKDIRKEEKQEARKDIIAQNECDRSDRLRSKIIKSATAGRARELVKRKQHHNNQKIIPKQVLKKEAKIRSIKVSILSAEARIKKAQRVRDDARDLYLRNIADFNKALDDIDKLRTLVETGLSNRGQGANSNDVRNTQSPTKHKITAPPTKAANDRRNTHGKVNAGALIELSSEKLAHLDHAEAAQTMRGIYSNLKSTVYTNPMVLAVVGTLDATMSQIEAGQAVDKIRSLLIQVRNELQKNKRQQTQAEAASIASWKDKKMKLRDAVNDLRIQWAGIYQAKADLWKKYGDEWTAEGDAMTKMAKFKARRDRNFINRAFERVSCKTAHAMFLRSSAKRHGQLKQISKVLKLLSKFGLGGKYGKMVRESIKDITSGLCRVSDDKSGWSTLIDKTKMVKSMYKFNTFPMNAWKVYNGTADGEKLACISKIRYTITSKKSSQVVTKVGSKYQKFNFGGSKEPTTRTMRFLKAKKETQKDTQSVIFFSQQFKDITINDISYYVVPNCNCQNPKTTVKHNQSNTANTDAQQNANTKKKLAAQAKALANKKQENGF